MMHNRWSGFPEYPDLSQDIRHICGMLSGSWCQGPHLECLVGPSKTIPSAVGGPSVDMGKRGLGTNRLVTLDSMWASNAKA